MSSGERFALVHSSIPFELRPAHVKKRGHLGLNQRTTQ
ncbi:hypothetical protein LEP1GSC073_3121 [Leptospira noguchii str. Cascata]|nr:hypothetical protein LEP1GSC073_3121 [Leptospira noguchii str. Cascata]